MDMPLIGHLGPAIAHLGAKPLAILVFASGCSAKNFFIKSDDVVNLLPWLPVNTEDVEETGIVASPTGFASMKIRSSENLSPSTRKTSKQGSVTTEPSLRQ